MLPAFLTTICFSVSIVCAGRSAKMIGGTEANFWRLTGAAIFLSFWAFVFGQGFSGASFPLFFISGLIGIGVGDVALFQTLPRLGSRLTILVVQCLTAPFAALIEWFWLHTALTGHQMLFGVIILAGIAISLAPDKNVKIAKKDLLPGAVAGILAALAGGYGAVLSRKAFAIAREQHDQIDGATAAFQRVTGGLLIGGICLLVVKWRSIKSHITLSGENLPPKEKWKRVWPWVLVNSLAGQTIGVSCYQWAFKTTPTGIVLPIVATAPLVAIPFSLMIEKERPSLNSLIGGVVAVAGVVGLTLSK